jgi:uncharacterized membrane protein YdbT with pleckstrin-like domain
MKILSNFDTGHANKLYKEYVDLFGEEYVILIHKSRLIWYATIFFPLAWFVLLTGIGAYVLHMYWFPSPIAYWAFWGLIVIRALILFFKLGARYVDFKMDFLLVTPKEVMKYDQQGVFSRTAEKISADKIKTITMKKEWFFASFFDVGTLIFLAEGDSASGDIMMEYVDTIEATEKKMRHVLGQDTRW